MRLSAFTALVAGLVLPGLVQAQVVTSIQTTTGPNGQVTQTQTTTQTGVAAATTEAQALSAQAAAATASIPGSGLAPTAAAGAGAGQEEGALLTASSTRLGGEYIVAQIHRANVLVFVGATATAPDLSPWLFFSNETARLQSNLARDDKQLADILHPPAPTGGRETANFIGAGIIAAAVVPKLLSYGYTNWNASGIALTPDDYMMDVALLEANHSWRIYAQTPTLLLPDDIGKTLAALDDQVNKATTDIVAGQTEAARVAAGDAGKKPENVARSARITAAVTLLTADVTAYNSFLSNLSTGANGATWSAVLQAHSIQQALDPSGQGGGVLFAKVHSASIGVLTKTNLFTNLGAAPIYASVGLVVSYVYYAPQATFSLSNDSAGNPIAWTAQPLPLTPTTAAIFEVKTPYRTLGRSGVALLLDSIGHCKWSAVARRGKDENLYCPAVYTAPG